MTGNDWIGYAGKTAVPQVHVCAADFRAGCAQQGAAWRQLGPTKLPNLDGLTWRRHDGREDAIGHTVTLSLIRMLFQTLGMASLIATLSAPVPAQAPPSGYYNQKARRHFVSISYDWQYTQAFGFGSHPLEDLLGQPVNEVHLETFHYRTQDGQTLVTVLEFSHPGQGIGLTVYPFGSSEGATLAVRGSIEQLPTIHLAFTGPAPAPTYAVTNGKAYDLGVGVDVADRSPGWGLGSHAFIMGGIGRARTDQGDGSRYFGEGGGGITIGPIGVDVSVKVAMNRFSVPVSHRFATMPISVRGTLTF
jgi:hypothetical protein